MSSLLLLILLLPSRGNAWRCFCLSHRGLPSPSMFLVFVLVIGLLLFCLSVGEQGNKIDA